MANRTCANCRGLLGQFDVRCKACNTIATERPLQDQVVEGLSQSQAPFAESSIEVERFRYRDGPSFGEVLARGLGAAAGGLVSATGDAAGYVVTGDPDGYEGWKAKNRMEQAIRDSRR